MVQNLKNKKKSEIISFKFIYAACQCAVSSLLIRRKKKGCRNNNNKITFFQSIQQ